MQNNKHQDDSIQQVITYNTYQRGSADLVEVWAALTLISLSIAVAVDETISISLPPGC